MISFLAPWALSGLAVLAVPVAIHLLKPRRVRVVPFSSLRWLRASQHRFSRRIQWHQILLFLLRAAVLALLVLAAARPVMRRGGAGSVHRFVIVDAGRAMNTAFRNHAGPMTEARRLADLILARTGPDRQTAVLVAGHAPMALGPLSAGPGRSLERIRNLKAEGTETPVTSALRLIPPLRRGAAPAETVELIFITSNPAPGWRQDDIAAFMREIQAPVRVRVLDTGARDPQNAWIASAHIRETAGGSRRQIRVRLGAAGNRRQTRALRLSGLSGMPDAVRDVVIEPGRVLWQDFDLPPALDLEKEVALLTLEPADGMADDDRFWLRLRPRDGQAVVVVEPDVTHIRELRPAFHLRTALETLAEAAPERFSFFFRTPRTLRDSELAAADLVFLVEPTPLSEPAMQALRERVAGGAALAVFTGPATDIDFFNRSLFNPLQPEDGLVTRRADGFVDMRDSRRLARLGGISWEHPVWSAFLDPAYGDLATAGFGGYLRLAPGAESGRERILASFPDQTPAVIESWFGAGRVMLLNTTANDSWSDLPRRRVFVPLVDSVIAYLTGFAGGGTFHVGEPLQLALPPDAVESSVSFLDPGNQPLRLALTASGGRRFARTAPVPQPGVYALVFENTRGETVREAVAVQTGRAYSSLATMDEDTLRSWWHPAEVSVTDRESAAEPLRALGARVNPESWLPALAIIALLVETVMCCRLCPRTKPVIVSESAISRLGFFNRGAALRSSPPSGASPS